uniref:Uncharacterized protein n=1 Tax=Arundo donax TaxID=35708 RepID=A0A0A9FQE2_ARUDO
MQAGMPCDLHILPQFNHALNISYARFHGSHFILKSIILVFGQNKELPRSLSRPRNFHINGEKKEK